MTRYVQNVNGKIEMCVAGYDELSESENLISLQNAYGGEWFVDNEHTVELDWIRDSEVDPWRAPIVITTRPELQIDEFIELFTPDEFVAIESLMTTNSIIRQFYKIAEVRSSVDMDDPRVDVAFDLFVTLGVMDEERKNDILNSL